MNDGDDAEGADSSTGAAQEQDSRSTGVARRLDGHRWQGGNPGPQAPKILRDMRHVFKHGRSKDKSDGQKQLRKVYEEDPKGFLSQLAALERQWMATSKDAKRGQEAERAVAPEKGVADPKSAMLKDLIAQVQGHMAEHMKTYKG